MSNTITRKVTTTQEVEIKLPYYSKGITGSAPWHYCVTAKNSMVVCCAFPDNTYTATGLRTDTEPAFDEATIEITREEFEQVYEKAIKLQTNSIPKA